ncbi:TonB-linked outer membrane protein, SusC/RagA family [Arachidicoccus rhizosphaerae]|uniref:TonB-linked outer membrane protein, SusC/RagA family n=1 Tax=Arachidicoccus rhizosphaerae TaxID=551991 RepID=A0A1H4BLB5_9BACT|nr:SusC/RagA family TonB-linked outer membrane protein [Arachidicoccus rhizosphaerae]SEA48844.1 TonB-linked outer membrane protein, SusC/RagA family [Arachidicoccus rhizosphaerae]
MEKNTVRHPAFHRMVVRPRQIFLVMRLTIIMLLFALTQVQAKSYAQEVTLDASSMSLKSALRKIESQTGYSFFYKDVDIQGKTISDLHINKAPLKDALNKILRQQQLAFVIKKKTIFIRTITDSPGKDRMEPEAQIIEQTTIKGHVTDRAGVPLSGVAIQLKGTTKGVLTNEAGDFSINLQNPEEAVLVVSFIGYITQEVAVKANSDLKIQLTEQPHQMNDIVVTALGIKSQEKALGYSVQKVGGEQVETVKGVDIGTSLTGHVAGLVVRNSTEFNQAPNIQLRGESPLLVIDGVPYGNVSLRDIPADDIQEMSVLKGSTAAALYGARGSNGAIMISTKKGTKNGGLSITLNSNTMFNLGYLAIPEVQTSYAHGQNGKISTDYVWGPKLDIGDSAIQWNPKTKQEEMMPLISSGKHNLQNFMQTGIITSNNISVTKSGENGYFRAGLNHVYNKGQFPNENLNIINYTMSGQIKMGDKFDLEGHMGYTRQTAPQIWGHGYNAQGYLYQILIWTGPDYDIRDYKDYWVTPNVKQNWLYNAWYDNPYLIANEKLDGIEQNKLNASLVANYHFSKDLKLMFRNGYDYYSNEETVRNPAGINSTRGGSSGSTFSWSWNGKGMYGMNELWGYSLNSDLILTYDKKIGDFGLNLLAGGSIYYYKDREFGAKTTNGLQVPGWYSLANAIPSTAVGVNSISNNYGTWARQVNSLYAKASANWKNAAFIDVTGREDWSSTQPASERSYFYPSVSTSLILSEFFHLPKVVNMWKLRGSWAVDKDMAGVYATNRLYSIGSSWGLTSSSYPNSLLPSDLLPSSTRTWEFGTAAYLLNSRLHFDIAYFSKLYYDRQTSVDISEASGFETTLVNTDETIARRGLEITIDGSIIKSKNFEWHSTLNYSNQHRYYVHLDPVYSSDNLWTKKGERVDTYLIYDWLRDPQGNIIHESGFPVESDYKTKIGYADPDFSLGWINDFTVGRFTFGLNIDGRIGGVMYDDVWDDMFETGASPETDTKWRYDQVVNGMNNYVGNGMKVVSGEATYDKYGRITNDTRTYAKNDVEVGYQDYEQSLSGGGNHGYFDETFIKVRELSIGYNIPTNKWFGKKSGIKSASVSLTAQNLFLFTGFKYSDPDNDAEDLNSPSQRMVGINIRLGF